eukprot:g1982.t1
MSLCYAVANIVFTHLLCLYGMCLSVRICSIASFVCLCWQDERTALIWAGRQGVVAVAALLLRAGPISTSDSFSDYVLARDKVLAASGQAAASRHKTQTAGNIVRAHVRACATS